MGKISMPQGKGSLLHNRRDYEKIGRNLPSNIDPDRVKDNIVLVDMNLDEAYEKFFGEALKEYNEKQKRSDRKIENYCEHIKKSKNGEKLFYEDVIQWGSKDDFKSLEVREMAKSCLKHYVHTFEERNPNLRLIGAYIHMDEASPHLHLDYVPVAHGYKSGLKARNSLNKALKEMGFEPKNESRTNNATMLWKQRERSYFGELCESIGLEVEAETKSQRKYLSPNEYKQARDIMLADINKELEEKTNEIQVKNEKIKNLDAATSLIALHKTSLRLENYTIPEKKNWVGQIKEPERQGTFVEGMNKKQIKAIIERVNIDEGLERAFESVQQRCEGILTQAREEAEGIKEEASAERNEAIAKANEIIAQQNEIIQKTREWVQSQKRKYQELTLQNEKLSRHEELLKDEIHTLEAFKSELEPLQKQYQELTRVVDIMSGKLDNELTEARIVEWDSFKGDCVDYIKQGKVFAEYRDGTTETVGLNERGTGIDGSVWLDQRDGICNIYVMADEERVQVPKSLMKELIQARDQEKPISSELKNLIKQQSDVEKVVSRFREKER